MSGANRRAGTIVAGLLVAALLLGSGAAQSAGSGEITLIHMGDVHGHLVPRPNLRSDGAGRMEGGLARMYALIDDIRKRRKHALLLNTGDTIQGSAEALFTRGQGLVDVINEFGVDAFAPGNWEFVYGTDRFLELFAGDHGKLAELDRLVAAKLGFAATYPVTGQTYTRKVDAFLVDALSGVAQSSAKFATDVRLLSRFRELREPLAEGQVGSSAQPYKANPMRCERVTSLSRWLISLAANPAHTAAVQWLERTLDDSTNRRLALPEAFLTADAILRITHNVAAGLTVYPAMVRRNLAAELPFLASEAILMAAVQRGGDRQEAHERLRVHARAASERMLLEGADNDFLDRVAADPAIPLDRGQIETLLDPHRFVGRAPQQVRDFLAEHVAPVLAAAGELPEATDLEV